MIVKIGDIAARCEACEGGEFERLSPGPLGLASILKCSGCGTSYTYLQLLDRIGEEAMRRANRALDESQGTKPRD